MKNRKITDYKYFPAKNRKIVNFVLSKDEKKQYVQINKDCLKNKFSQSRTQTTLSDLVSSFSSKKNKILDIISSNKGTTYVFFNLSSEANKFASLCKRNGLKNVNCCSYKLSSSKILVDAKNLIYAEYPLKIR